LFSNPNTDSQGCADLRLAVCSKLISDGEAGFTRVRSRDVADRPILLKKSLDAVDPIFSASLVRFLNEDAVDLIAKR
jgi:hypothetical protein